MNAENLSYEDSINILIICPEYQHVCGILIGPQRQVGPLWKQSNFYFQETPSDLKALCKSWLISGTRLSFRNAPSSQIMSGQAPNSGSFFRCVDLTSTERNTASNAVHLMDLREAMMQNIVFLHGF